MINVGIVGVGGSGSGHLRAFQGLPNCKVVAICDVNRERLLQVQAEHNVPEAFEDHREMLSLRNLDAVAVITPNRFHAPITVDALRAGKHVLVTKPMATNAREAERMVEAAEEAHRILMVHYSHRYMPDVQWLKGRIDAGQLGEIYYTTARFMRQGIPKIGGWFTTRAESGGGALIDLGVHLLDLSLWLMGFPEPVCVRGYTYSRFGRRMLAGKPGTFDVEDLARALVGFENGASLLLEAAWACHTPARLEKTVQLLGTEAGALLNMSRAPKEFPRRPRLVVSRMQDENLVTPPEGFRPPLRSSQAHFIDCILKDKQPIAPGQHGLATVRVLEAAYESAATGSEVKI